MRMLSARTRRELERRDDEWVKKARELVQTLGKGDKERQLRNIQNVAEESHSWQAVSLFIRYQAARGQLDKTWAENTITLLEGLQNDAQGLVGSSNSEQVKDVHLELVARTLGYAVRWHVWDMKDRERAA